MAVQNNGQNNGRLKANQVFEVTGKGFVRLYLRVDQSRVLTAGEKVQVVSSELKAFFRSRSDFNFLRVRLLIKNNHGPTGLIHFAHFNASEMTSVF